MHQVRQLDQVLLIHLRLRYYHHHNEITFDVMMLKNNHFRGDGTYQTQVRLKSFKYTHSTGHNHRLGETQFTIAKFR